MESRKLLSLSCAKDQVTNNASLASSKEQSVFFRKLRANWTPNRGHPNRRITEWKRWTYVCFESLEYLHQEHVIWIGETLTREERLQIEVIGIANKVVGKDLGELDNTRSSAWDCWWRCEKTTSNKVDVARHFERVVRVTMARSFCNCLVEGRSGKIIAE
jgi:hypothetical protein